MAVTTSTATEVPALTSPAAAAAREPEAVGYPEGHWIAQSVVHGVTVRQAETALDLHFRERSEVLVAMQLLVYHELGNNAANIQPDVKVVFGMGRGYRSSYRVWDECKAPDFVLEVASPSTADTDRGARVLADRPAGGLDEQPAGGQCPQRGPL